MKKIELDVAWDSYESLESLLAEYGSRFPRIHMRVERLAGSAGGWPEIEFVGTDADLREFLEFYGADAIDIDEYMLEAVPI